MKNAVFLVALLNIGFISKSIAQVSVNPEVKVASSIKPQKMKEIKEMFSETFGIVYNVKSQASVSAQSLTGNSTTGVQSTAIFAVKPETFQAATDSAYKIFIRIAQANGYTYTDNTPYQNFEVFSDGKTAHTPASSPVEIKNQAVACIGTTPSGFTSLSTKSIMKKIKAYKDVKALAANVSLVINFIDFDGKASRLAQSAKISTGLDLNLGGATGCHKEFSEAKYDAASSLVSFMDNASTGMVLLGLKDVFHIDNTSAKLTQTSNESSNTTGLLSLYYNNSGKYVGYVVSYDNEQDFVKEMSTAFTTLFEAYFKALKESME